MLDNIMQGDRLVGHTGVGGRGQGFNMSVLRREYGEERVLKFVNVREFLFNVQGNIYQMNLRDDTCLSP